MRAATRATAGILLLAAAIHGQQPEQPDESIVIRSTTSLVQVHLVAEDASGKPVTDLKREDFQLQDNRKPQPITLFSLDLGAAAADTATESGSPPGASPGPPSYALIVLDWLNTKYSDRIQAKDLLIRMLRSYQPRQKVALYLLGHEPRLIRDFTADREELIQAVEDAGLDPANMGDDTPGRFDARAGSPTRRASVEEQLFFMNNRINDSLHTLRDITNHLSHVPGRKSLVWISDGFPMVVGPGVIPGVRPAELVFHQDVSKVIEQLNRSDVAVYAVDADGLPVSKPGFPGTLQEFAERTGGTAFINRNDLDVGLRMALEDMKVSYVLGFHVPENAAPGLHEIRVTVNRSGVRLRYRTVYQLK